MKPEAKQAFKYAKQLLHDLDIALNHDGKGKTYGVSYTLDGDKKHEIQDFVEGKYRDK